MERWIEFIGHFHPLLVHLPIGILLMTALLMVLSTFQRIQLSAELLKLFFLAGIITAALSCITGFMLSQSGEYDANTLNLHQWMGISVAVISIVSYFSIRKGEQKKFTSLIVSGLIVIFISITGHLGGSLTHGSDYLTAPLQSTSEEENLSIVNLDSAMFYTHLVKPILKTKCYSCHGSEKQKGKLRLDEKEYILKGGKHGDAIIFGKPNDSELIARVELELSHKDHMPPKEKSQLTNQEKEIIKLWIESGADFEMPVKLAANFQKVKSIIGNVDQTTIASDVPAEDIKAVDDSEINKLTEQGIMVTPVAAGSHYLSVSFISVPDRASTLISSLTKINDNIVWLKLSGTNMDDTSAASLSQLSNLIRLSLDDTKITDDGLKNISTLKHLHFLNLKGTPVSIKGLESLNDLKELKSLFLYRTKVTEKEQGKIQELFPHAQIDFGNYTVPTLSSDTTLVKVK
jgi:uncharacterized membrane protein